LKDFQIGKCGVVTYVDISNSKLDPMSASVTVHAERNQIFRSIMAKFTSRIKMMDLQHFCGAAILASPSIPVQNLNFEGIVPLWI
jgi:hypothetical protein